MKHRVKIFLILLIPISAAANPQVPPSGQGLQARTHLLGYWVDPITLLVWTGTDGGRDVNLYQAIDYCRDLDLKGYSNWRLPTIEELEAIYERSAVSQRTIERFHRQGEVPYTLNIKGDLSLTGDPWSSGGLGTDPGHPATRGWYFDFNRGTRISDDPSSATGKRALCVRRSDVVTPPKSSSVAEQTAKENQSLGYWVDSVTGLVWAANDSGKSVTWSRATKYCRDLRLAGYADWRLASLDELETLVVNGAYDPGRADDAKFDFVAAASDRSVRGELNLVDDPWSSNRPLNEFHHPYSDGWFFDFRTSQPSYDLQQFRNTKSALCVRRPTG